MHAIYATRLQVNYNSEAQLLDIHRLILFLWDRWWRCSKVLALFRELSLVQRHADSVHLLNRSVKVRLEVTVRSERVLDMTCPSVLRV